MSWDSDYDDDYEDDDYGETLTVPCQNCGADVYEDAPACPVCGEYVTKSTSALEGRPMWFVLLGLIGIIATVIVLAGLGG